MKNEITLKNKKDGREITLVRKSSQPAPKPVNIRRVASTPSGRRSA